MPRRLVKDGYRGWYGWEARFNSMIRMSLESMNNTNAKNKRERFQFSKCQLQIREDEKKFAEKTRKELYDVKQELFNIRAYGKVYQKYSFSNSENAQKAENHENTVRIRTANNNEEIFFYSEERDQKERNDKSVLNEDSTEINDGGNWQIERLPKITRVTFADTKEHGISEGSHESHSLTENNDPLHEAEEVLYEPKLLSLPSVVSVYRKKQDDASERTSKYQAMKRQNLVSKWNKVITVVREQVKAEKSEAESSDTSSSTNDMNREADENVSRSRKLKRAMEGGGEKTKQEIRAKIFPAECRNTFTLRRFIDRQADDLLKVWTPETVRRHKVQKILEKVKFPELVHRNRTTSAIFRDYHVYERVRGLKHDDGTEPVEENINEISLRSLKAKYSDSSESTSCTSSVQVSAGNEKDLLPIRKMQRGILKGRRREITIAVPAGEQNKLGKITRIQTT